MKDEREELEQPEWDGNSAKLYTPTTSQAIITELRRGGDPHKIARYFDVSIHTVLRKQAHVKIIKEIMKRSKDGNKDSEKRG